MRLFNDAQTSTKFCVEIENNGKSNGYEIFHFGGLRFYNYRKMRGNLKINTGRGGGVLKREGGVCENASKKYEKSDSWRGCCENTLPDQ